MSKRISTEWANYINGQGGWAQAFEGGVLMFYSGAQPASADAAATGTALVRLTKSAGAWTKEVKATTLLGLSAVTANPTALTIGGVAIATLTALPTFTTAAQLAIDLAASINTTLTYPDFKASVSGTDVTVTSPKNSGANLNGLAVVCTATGGAAINGGSSTTLGGAGATAGVSHVNGLQIAYPATAGVSAKTGVWQGLGGSGTGAGYIGFTNSFTAGTLTAGWFRFYASPNDPELAGTPTADTQYMRYDGSIATSGGDMTASGGTTVTFGATHTQNTFTVSTPLNQ